jgi:hypothetical protein
MNNPKIFLANVGANATHRFESPIFPDGTFEMIPIIESPPDAGPHSVRMGEVPSWKNPTQDLSKWIPERYRDMATHFDPEFITRTYGDNCERAARAYSLKKASRGDLIFFLARLKAHNEPDPAAQLGFYLVGFIELEDILSNVRTKPTPEQLQRFGSNAHVRKGLNDDAHWDGFWVFGGSERSVRFSCAIPVDRQFCDAVLRTASEEPFQWSSHRSELQVIGSYTRTCRVVLDEGNEEHKPRIEVLTAIVNEYNPGTFPD